MNDRQNLFNDWKLLGERVKQLGAIIQNPVEHISYQNYQEFLVLSVEIQREIVALHNKTTEYIWDKRTDEWAENGELDK